MSGNRREKLSLSVKQRGVLKGVVAGLLISGSLLAAGAVLNPLNFQSDVTVTGRLSVAAASSVLPVLFLAISIGRLAKHRFFSPEAIDGGGLTPGSDEAKYLQSLLQNTVEQVVLAIPVYFAWALLLPAPWLSAVPIAATTFGIGRVLFFVGYRHGAPSRALGFALTFYPTVGMLICILASVLMRLFS
jgi:hypothetical protein